MPDHNKNERMCVACRSMKPKSTLIRVIKSGEDIFLDLSGKANGRGAYICKNEECIKQAMKRKSLNRSLKCNVPEEVYSQIMELMS